MTKKTSIISNIAIAMVLLVLSLAVFTTDLTSVYVTVAAPVYNGNKNQKNVSLVISVFECGTNQCDEAKHIENMMAVLTEKGAGATFFVGGAWAMKNANLVKNMSAGFELGNNAYSGKDMKKMSAAAQKKEIQTTHAAVKNLAGVDMKLFMPPLGSFTKTTLKVAEESKYTTVMFSKNATCTASDCSTEAVTNKATQNLKNGDLVLLHPDQHTAQALPEIIDFYLSQGFNVVPVGANISLG